MSAPKVIAAGSVMKDPISGTSAKPSQTCATSVRIGASFANLTTMPSTVFSTGLDAATTMMTNTNSGSVYCRVSAYMSASSPPTINAIATISTTAHNPKTTSTSPKKCSRPACFGCLCASRSNDFAAKVWIRARAKIMAATTSMSILVSAAVSVRGAL